MLSRSRLLTLFALAAMLTAGLLAGCGGGDDDSGGGGGSGDKAEDPVALLKKALATDVKSGELKAKVGVDVEGSRQLSGPIAVTLDGPFQTRGDTQLPLLDWDISVSGMGQNFSGGVVATEDNAFVKFRGQTYEVGTRLYEQFVRQSVAQSKDSPQTLEELGIDPSGWLQDAKVGDGESIGGSATRKVTGKIDVEKMIDDLLKAAENPSLRKQLESGGQQVPEISDADKQKVVDAVKDASLTVNVDDKDVARRVAFSASFDVPEGADADGATGGKVDFEYELPKVGGDADITAPSGAKPLSLLLQQLGLGGNLPGGGLRTQ